MKRVKVMLAAIAVLAVVGGTLAFKAQKFTFETLYISDGSVNNCNIPVNDYTRKAGSPLTISASTTNVGTNNCTTLTVTDIEP